MEQLWETISKRAKQTHFTHQHKQSDSQIDRSLSKQRKDWKASNGPCDLGPKQDQKSFEWRNEQSPKNRNETMNNYLENVDNQSGSWQDNQNTKTPKEGSIH